MSDNTSRRALLGTIGTAVTGATVGCLGDISPGLGTDETLRLPSVVSEGDLPDGSVPLVPAGRVALVNFFATWCPHCKEEMPALRKAREEYDTDDLHMVSVTSQSSADTVRAFWNLHDATWPVVTDPDLEATAKYEVDGYPTNLLFDAAGEPATVTGTVPADSFETLSRVVDPLIE